MRYAPAQIAELKSQSDGAGMIPPSPTVTKREMANMRAERADAGSVRATLAPAPRLNATRVAPPEPGYTCQTYSSLAHVPANLGPTSVRTAHAAMGALQLAGVPDRG